MPCGSNTHRSCSAATSSCSSIEAMRRLRKPEAAFATQGLGQAKRKGQFLLVLKYSDAKRLCDRSFRGLRRFGARTAADLVDNTMLEARLTDGRDCSTKGFRTGRRG